MKKILSIAIVASAFPGFAFATCVEGVQGTITNLCTLILRIDDLVSSTVWLLISLAVIFIVWNAVQFIRHTDDTQRGTYRNAVMWGIVGLAIILSIWGLVYILRNTFFVDNISGRMDSQSSIDNLILKRSSGSGSSGANRINCPVLGPDDSPAPGC